jgi:glycosyltransferase involved in cell wall biosynthesis
MVSRREIREIVSNVHPDTIHVQSHFTTCKEVLIAGKSLGIPVIGTNHFMPENLIHYLHPPHALQGHLSRLAWKQCVHTFQRLDAITTPTKTAADAMVAAGFTKKIIPISCGIDLERFRPRTANEMMRKRYGIPLGVPVLLYVGRLDKEKQIEVALQGLAAVRHHMDVHLCIVGDGKEHKHLTALAGSLGLDSAVTFTGRISDASMEYIHSIADLFVMPSIAELQSIATMEAMACGLPVVAANAMALPELVHNGKNGYVFPAGDSEAFASRVQSILADTALRKQMGEESLSIISSHSIQNTLTSFEELYAAHRRTS